MFSAIFYMLFSCITACYLYPKYHIRVFIIYSLLLPICLPISHILLTYGYINFDTSDLSFAITCTILYSSVFFYFIKKIKKYSQTEALTIKVRHKFFFTCLVTYFFYFFLTLPLLFIFTSRLSYLLFDFRFIYSFK